MLRQMVKAAREGRVLVPAVDVTTDPRQPTPKLVQVGTCDPFTPAAFTEAAIRWMGEDYQACTPAAVMALRGPGRDDDKDDDPDDAVRVPAAGQPAPAAPRGGDDQNDDGEDDVERDEIERNASGSDPDDGPDNRGSVATLAHPGLAADAASVDPRDGGTPLKLPPGTTIDMSDEKPEPPNDEQATADLDAAVVKAWNDGLREVTPADLGERMQYAMKPWTMTRRIGALVEGARVHPQGITFERLAAGRYALVKMAPSPRPRAPKGGE
jgi:hypothetical protein